MEPSTQHHKHPWRARLVIGLIMLIFSFIGLVISDVKKEGAWLYWRIMVPIFALLCLWLSWYLRRVKHSLSAIKIWHEILHWCGLLISVYLVSIFVDMGVMERLDASLVVIILLALTTFIAGIYIEFTFIPIGIMLGLFSVGAALTEEYLYTVMLPITIAVAAFLVWLIHRMKEKHIQDNIEKK
ncbi:MAG: hypothetical protein HY860_02715 [Chlamydiales bacterium]|nr:hypothetical protein [Chlamydiales bacterium]